MWSIHDRSDRWTTQIRGTRFRSMCQYREMGRIIRIFAMIKWNWGRIGNDVLHVNGACHYGCKMGSHSLKHLMPMIFVRWDCSEEWTEKEFFVVELLWSEIVTDVFGRIWIMTIPCSVKWGEWCPPGDIDLQVSSFFSIKYGNEFCFNYLRLFSSF